MKIKEGFELRTLFNEHIVLAYGRQNINFSKVINLNESAALMWNAVIGKEFTTADMAAALMAEYEEKLGLCAKRRIIRDSIDNIRVLSRDICIANDSISGPSKVSEKASAIEEYINGLEDIL